MTDSRRPAPGSPESLWLDRARRFRAMARPTGMAASMARPLYELAFRWRRQADDGHPTAARWAARLEARAHDLGPYL